MDLKNLMKQAQEMQKKMQKAQEELANKEFEGTSGAGLVKVILKGNGVAKKISIDNSIVSLEEKEVMEDLIIAAINDAKNKLDQDGSSTMSAITGNMKLPSQFGF